MTRTLMRSQEIIVLGQNNYEVEIFYRNLNAFSFYEPCQLPISTWLLELFTLENVVNLLPGCMS